MSVRPFRCWPLVLATGLVACSPAPVDPDFLDVRFPGSYTEPGTVAVPAAGDYAIWATGSPPAGATRCSVSTEDGDAVPVSAPEDVTTYTAEGEDGAVYTWTDAFTAPRAGTYVLRCRLTPEAPGMSFAVSAAPA